MPHSKLSCEKLKCKGVRLRSGFEGESTYDEAVWDLCFVGDSHNRFKELDEGHIDMSVFVDFVDLGHHRSIEWVTDLFLAKDVTEAVAVDYDLSELTK